jgi:predicted O-methyltransferase YrrM
MLLLSSETDLIIINDQLIDKDEKIHFSTMASFVDLFRFIDKYLVLGGIPRFLLWKFVHRLLKRLIMLEIKAYRDIDGWLSYNEATALYLLSKLMPPRTTIVEIGCWKGKSTYCLAKGLPKNGEIIAIDPFDGSGDPASHELYEQKRGRIPLFDQFMCNMESLNVLDRIRPKRGFSYQFVGQFPKIDLLFIDGDHSIEGCDFDFLSYSSFIPSGGLVAFHDFDKSRNDIGSTWVVKNRVLPSSDYEFWGSFDSLWVAQKL